MKTLFDADILMENPANTVHLEKIEHIVPNNPYFVEHSIYFAESLTVFADAQRTQRLTLGLDYEYTALDSIASEQSNQDCYRALLFLKSFDCVYLDYHSYGDLITADIFNTAFQTISEADEKLRTLSQKVRILTKEMSEHTDNTKAHGASDSVVPESIVLRTAQGTIKAHDATQDSELAAFGQMKTAIGTAKAELNSAIKETKGELLSTIDAKITALIDNAPEALNTLKELADALNKNKDGITALNTALSNRYTKQESDTRDTQTLEKAKQYTDSKALQGGQPASPTLPITGKNVAIRDTEISVENAGWKGAIRRCDNGVEFALEQNGVKKFYTKIDNGLVDLYIKGSIHVEKMLDNWTKRSLKMTANNSVCYGDGRWFIAGRRTLLGSTDAVNWTKISDYNNMPLRSIHYGNGIWVVASDKDIITSKDASNWFSQFEMESALFLSVHYGNGTWVAVGRRDIFTSTDAMKWTKRKSLETGFLYSVRHGNGTWVAVGYGAILTSQDAMNWVAQKKREFGGLYSVHYGNGIWVAVGDKDIFTSTDAVNWIKRNSPQTGELKSVHYGNDTWVAVGDKDILTSTDAVSWTRRNSPQTGELKSVHYGNGTWVAVGDKDILTSGTTVL